MQPVCLTQLVSKIFSVQLAFEQYNLLLLSTSQNRHHKIFSVQVYKMHVYWLHYQIQPEFQIDCNIQKIMYFLKCASKWFRMVQVVHCFRKCSENSQNMEHLQTRLRCYVFILHKIVFIRLLNQGRALYQQMIDLLKQSIDDLLLKHFPRHTAQTNFKIPRCSDY